METNITETLKMGKLIGAYAVENSQLGKVFNAESTQLSLQPFRKMPERQSQSCRGNIVTKA